MKMTALFEGLEVKNSKFYDTHDLDGGLRLRDGTSIWFYGEENNGPNDCYNYADWSALEDTGFFEDTSITAETLKLEPCEYGFRINGYFVPCYSCQNGYYTSALTIRAEKDNKLIAEIECEGA